MLMSRSKGFRFIGLSTCGSNWAAEFETDYVLMPDRPILLQESSLIARIKNLKERNRNTEEEEYALSVLQEKLGRS